MKTEDLKILLESYRLGNISTEEVLSRLRQLPFEDMGFAKIDHHRSLRQGFPEVIFGQGKTVEQLQAITRSLIDTGQDILITRIDNAIFTVLSGLVPGLTYHPQARCATRTTRERKDEGVGYILILAAGTSDVPVAEEAAVTCQTMGHMVRKTYDVGVAGLHRLLSQMDLIMKAEVIIVVAGMDGALPSVVGGLTHRPVIAVPTSVGYGASFGGLAALLTMLNSCASGVTVVNIDNGFGAGFAAAMINRRRD